MTKTFSEPIKETLAGRTLTLDLVLACEVVDESPVYFINNDLLLQEGGELYLWRNILDSKAGTSASNNKIHTFTMITPLHNSPLNLG